MASIAAMDSSVSAPLKELSKKNILFGTSSWKYEGWKGRLYTREYKSQKKFNDNCLEEYADHYPLVGIDHTYYAWPVPSTFNKYIELTPQDFQFGLKATEAITTFRYPNIKRYGKVAGKMNETFLDAAVFEEKFLKVVEPYKDRIAVIMFEFTRFRSGTISSGREFIERLDQFFEKLPTREYPFAVELRNQNWLEKPYFDLLQKHGVSHVFNSWTLMPTVSDQLHKAGDFKPPAYPVRLLLKPGQEYDDAVDQYSPYDKLMEVVPEIRRGAVDVIRRAMEQGVPCYVFVNNRAEGCALDTIDGIVQELQKH